MVNLTRSVSKKLVILSLPKDLQSVPFFKRVVIENDRESSFGGARRRRILARPFCLPPLVPYTSTSEVLRQAQDDIFWEPPPTLFP
jgi:hypothetical protein